MEYRSNLSFLGLPLLHVAFGSSVDGVYRRGVATAWVAVGDIAIGVIVSCGGVALGGICLGGASFGLISFGGLAFAVIAVGGLSVGLFAVGGAAFGWFAAMGGLAVAHDYAVGGAAFGQHVLSPLSGGFRTGYPHPQALFRVEDALWLLVLVTVLLLFARRIQQWRKRQ